MGWFKDIFVPREKVNLKSAFPGILDITRSSPKKKSSKRNIPGIAKLPERKEIGSRGLSYFTTNNKEWVPPQYDHLEVEILYDIEGYFARATRAKLNLFMKEGYSFIGKNEERIKYIKTRLHQIERVSSIPFEILLLTTFRDLVVHSNSYWLKVRKTEASGGRVRVENGTEIKPIAGFFRLPPETMIPEIDKNGNIVRWKQDIGGYEKIFNKRDIVHIYTNTKAGYPLGIPRIVPAIDDIRALRSLEHNIDILIHKHLFPIILWKVGTENQPAEEYADGTTEIEIVKDRVEDLPTEGSLVIPERYDVKAVGIENKALKVESYLQHFRERLLADLDVSSIDVGIGSSASRSTASTLSRNLIDTVKMDQITIEAFSRSIIEELLIESTFPELTVLDEENLVFLKFKEIDKESKQAEENHYIDSFAKNAITWPELRLGIGREVISEEEQKELFFHKFAVPLALIQSVDESSGLGENGAVENKSQPKNQHGTRPAPKLNKDEIDLNKLRSSTDEDQTDPSKDINLNPILNWHKTLEKSIKKMESLGNFDQAELNMILEAGRSETKKSFFSIIRRIVRSNYPDPTQSHLISKICERRSGKAIDRLYKELIRRIENKKSVTAAFKSLEYRTSFIYNYSTRQAYNLSKFRYLRDHQIDTEIVPSETCCDLCASKLTVIHHDDKLGEAKIPPFHDGCACGVRSSRS